MPEIIINKGFCSHYLIKSGDCGKWNDCLGNEVIHQHLLPNVETGDRVLDLCSGWGRISIPLAFKGARITFVDTNQNLLDCAKEALTEANLSYCVEKVLNVDINKLTPEDIGHFKFIIACGAINHMKKMKAVDFIARIPHFLHKKKSFICLDAPCKLGSSAYDSFRQDSSRKPIDLDTYEDVCGCSGTKKLETIPFFTPGEIESIFINNGGRILTNRITRVNDRYSNSNIIAEFS